MRRKEEFCTALTNVTIDNRAYDNISNDDILRFFFDLH